MNWFSLIRIRWSHNVRLCFNNDLNKSLKLPDFSLSSSTKDYLWTLIAHYGRLRKLICQLIFRTKFTNTSEITNCPLVAELLLNCVLDYCHVFVNTTEMFIITISFEYHLSRISLWSLITSLSKISRWKTMHFLFICGVY